MTAVEPSTLLFGKTRLRIMAELVRSNEEWLHVREIARRSEVHSVNASRELKTLKEARIVESKQVGRQIFYRLNARCPIYAELKGIILKTVGLADVIRDALEPLSKRIKLAYIYGSFASGETTPESDVDIMVIGTVKLYDIVSALMSASRVLCREVNPTVYTPKEYKLSLAKEEGFVYEVHNGPRIPLLGEWGDFNRT